MAGQWLEQATPAPVPASSETGALLQRLVRLRAQAPVSLATWLAGRIPGPALTSRNGDLTVFECRSQWAEPCIPPLACHLVVVALSAVGACAVGLPGAAPQEGALGVGDVVILPAGEAALLRLSTPHHLLLVGLRPRQFYGDGAAATRPAEPPPVLSGAAFVADPVMHGIALALRACGPGAGLLADHLGRALAAHLLLRHARREKPTRSALGDTRLQRALAFLESHLGEPVTLADAAQAAGCSVHHFAHLFKSTMGLSPMRHLLKLRMQRALELVQTTQLSMGEIGCHVGLPDPARFSQAFRAYWNSAPSALRKHP